MEGAMRRNIRKLLSHRIDSRKLKPGDHIYVYRALKTYSHHGIYLGGENHCVIHFTRKGASSTQGEPCLKCGYDKSKSGGGVVKSCLDCFIKEENLLGGNSLYLYEYGVSYIYLYTKNAGTCSANASKPPNEVIETATKLHKNNGFGEYNLITNNCEDFATFCKTGVKKSKQVEAKLGMPILALLTYSQEESKQNKEEESKQNKCKQTEG